MPSKAGLCYADNVSMLTVPIEVTTPDDAAAAVEAAQAASRAGADLIEWRLDSVVGLDGAGPCMATLLRDTSIESVLTCRSVQEGGSYQGGDEDLALWCNEIATLSEQPCWVDVEYAAWQRSGSLQAAASVLRGRGIKVLLSWHDFQARPHDLLRTARNMQEAECDGVKLVWRARSVRDAVECRDLLADRSKPMIALCMGPHGVLSRVMAGAWGGLMTFAAADSTSATAPGQPTLMQLQDQYRFRHLTPETEIFGLIGDPLGDSPGYRLHNAAFAAADFNGVYLPLPTAAGWESLKATLSTLIGHPDIHFRGASVTLPHKSDLIRFVQERGGVVSPMAAASGAANTLLVRDDGQVVADNTDVHGIMEPLRVRGAVFEGGRAVVLGAGGVARAATCVLLQHGMQVDIVNRTIGRAEQLVKDFSSLGTIAARSSIEGAVDVIVQATSVGMAHGSSPQGNVLEAMSIGYDSLLKPNTVAIETVYDPVETPFVTRLKAAGCQVATGQDMWRAQGAAQQMLWTGQAPPSSVWM